jgi:DNA-binding NarL/FixJ family response regulator
MKELRIFVADDHPLIREGLRRVVETQPGWTICGEAEDGRTAVKLGLELKPDVYLLDISMPQLNGLDVARQIRRERPNAAILIVTVDASDGLRAELMEAGASGCVSKSDSPRQVLAAVEAVANGKQYFTGVVDGESGSMGATSVRMPPRLTAREREIVQLLAEGRTNKEIAALLGIAYKTVDAHRSNIMRRLSLRSFAEMVRYAIRERFVQP